MWNAGSVPARLIEIISPAGFEHFFREVTELVGDPEGQGKRLLEACGLPWTGEILEFHKGNRAIKTASLWQARQRIYRSSSKRWANYAAHIGDLANELAAFLQDDRNELASLGVTLKQPGGIDRLKKRFA